ncbi:hypothetical protein BV898_02156 [Hypsibius exemplaris]|uniref:Receptor ligand binding region domain-containing protein n=1 Tax=Hypsibius exemplaris TaxID=2072580 RepID=A0A1W0X9J5_HYPEX|nr:hypothetical protein BV898_02156 [Hypsibius exemplaris]
MRGFHLFITTLRSLIAFFYLYQFLVGGECLSLPRRRVNIVSPGFFNWPQTTSLSHIAPAVETGLAAVRGRYPHINWTAEFLLSDHFKNCDGLKDNIQAELSRWYYTQAYSAADVLTVIITPGCYESRYMSQLAAGWDVLLITSMDYTENMGNRNQFPSYVTTSPKTPVNGVILCALLVRMNWTRVYLLHDTSSDDYYGYQAINLHLSMPRNCGVLLTRQQFASASENASQALPFILQDFNSKSRVLLYLGAPAGMRPILVEAKKQNMTYGEHVFLAITNDDAADGNDGWQAQSENDQAMRSDYQAILLVKLVDTVALAATAPMRQLVPEWRTLALSKYNNTNLKNMRIQTNVAGHTAIELMAEAVEAANPGGWTNAPPGGKLLADQLLNRTFDLQIGKAHMLAQGQLSVQHRTVCFDLKEAAFKV